MLNRWTTQQPTCGKPLNHPWTTQPRTVENRWTTQLPTWRVRSPILPLTRSTTNLPAGLHWPGFASFITFSVILTPLGPRPCLSLHFSCSTNDYFDRPSSTILHYSVPSCTILHHVAPSGTILHDTEPSGTTIHHSVPSGAILRHPAPFCTIWHKPAPSCTIWHLTSPCCTIWHYPAPSVASLPKWCLAKREICSCLFRKKYRSFDDPYFHDGQ